MNSKTLVLALFAIIMLSCTGRDGSTTTNETNEKVNITEDSLVVQNEEIQKTILIASNSVDGVVIGKKIDDFIAEGQQRYSVKKETMNMEGDDYVIYNVYEGERKLYSVEPDFDNPDVIDRIWVYDSKCKTKEGIGVNSSLADIKSKYTIEYISTEEGLSIHVKEIPVAFIPDESKVPDNWWGKADYKKLPDNLPILKIIVN